MSDRGEASREGPSHGMHGEAAREGLCRKCGECCHVKIEVEGWVVITPYVCPHLDPETRLCAIYERRHELNPLCTSPEAGILEGFWPGTCAYAKAVPGYVGPRKATPEEAKQYEEPCQVVQELIRQAAERLRAASRQDPAPLPFGTLQSSLF